MIYKVCKQYLVGIALYRLIDKDLIKDILINKVYILGIII